MTNTETTSHLPENFNELKKAVNRTADWEARLHAVNELSTIQADEAMKILHYVAKTENVTKVREAAAKSLKKKGQSVPTYEVLSSASSKIFVKYFYVLKKAYQKTIHTRTLR